MYLFQGNHYRLALVLFLGGLLALSARGQELEGRKFALLIGVKHYDKSGLPDLAYAEADVRALGQVLRESGFRLVTLMTQTAGAKKSRYVPRAKNIRDELAGFLDGKRKADTVVIAFSGHGVQFPGGPAAGSGWPPYLCPLDAQLEGKANLISLQEIYKALEQCQAGTRLVLVDAGRDVVLLPPKGVAAVFSCAEGQKSHDCPKLKHGVFFYYLSEALKGEAADKKGVVTADRLKTYLQDQVYDHVWEHFGRKQMPTFKGDWSAFPPWLAKGFDKTEKINLALKEAGQKIALLEKTLKSSTDREKSLTLERDKLMLEWKIAVKATAVGQALLDKFRVDLDKLKNDKASAEADLTAKLRAREALARKQALEASLRLDDAKKNIASLQEELAAAADQAKLLKELADGRGKLLKDLADRFSGFPLTGKNVVFLIDMSGSMALLDESTLDPDKWPLLCDTVGRIMKSLPDIKQYQIILFSDKVRYPFGKAGQWLEYDPKTTPPSVVKGLRAVKPEGETNMYAAFEEAFKFRARDLDTIYVFSDGLPNAGPGLSAKAGQLSERQRSEILAKHVRARLKSSWNAAVPGQPRVRINTLGFFFETPEIGSFLWALAREHEGGFVGMR